MNLTQAKLALREAQLKKGHRKTTRVAYRYWVVRYSESLIKGHCSDLQTFLDTLVTGPARISSATVKQALNALVFFHRYVLEKPVEGLRVPSATRAPKQPEFLTSSECEKIFRLLTGTVKLQAMLLYGTGLRVREILTLRLKDVCLQSLTIRCQEAKGGKTRTVALPARLAGDLSDHIARIKAQWQQDSARRITCPPPEPSLARKLGPATFGTLPWYWVFPSRAVRGLERWHATSQGLDKALKTAAGQAGIAKRISPHVFRHSYITSHFLRGADPRTVQVYVGHTRLETTMRYAHAAGRFGLPSPLDLPAPENVLAFPDLPAPAALPASRKRAPR